MLRRHLPILLAALLLTTACTKSAPQRTLPTAPEPGQIILHVGVFFEGNDLNPIIDAYEATHDNVKIEKVSFKTQADITEAVKVGKVDLFNARAGGFVRLGTAVDLEPYIRKTRFDTSPLGTLMDAHREAGQIHSLPTYGNPFVLVYNKELVAEAGVTVPDDGLTWDQLREMAQKPTKGKGPTKQWGMSLHFQPEYLAYTLALELAGEGRPVQPEHVEAALRYFHTLMFTDESLPPSTPREPPTLYYYQGRAAFTFQTLSTLRQLPQDKLPGIAPPPAGVNKKPVVLLDMVSYGVSAASANPDAAWEFLAFAAGPEGATAMAKAGYFPLYATDAVRQAWLDVTPPPPAGVEPVLKAAWYPVPFSVSSGTPLGVYMAAARDVLTGDTTVDLAMRIYRADMAQFK
jgi:multiple sugar transport system substrate-binding protein